MKKNRGITMVALVITIVVLLIIAGISIGAGNNAISRMIEDNVRGVSFYMINTETGTLKRSRTSNILQIGVQTTRGLGAGANEIVGERAAIENIELGVDK